MAEVAVIVVTYNVEDCLRACLCSVVASVPEGERELVVVDNASTDGTVAVARSIPAARVLKNSENVGFARASNRGMIETSAPYILLLNPDARLQDGALKKLLDAAERHPRAAVLGPRILNPDGTLQGSARGFPDFLTSFFGRTSLFTRLLPGNAISRRNLPALQHQDSLTIREVDWVSGAAMLIRRSALEKVGLLDENFYLFWEDADWCYRMRQNGFNVLYCTEPVVVHDVGGSVATNRVRSVLEFHRSAYRWYVKHRAASLFNPKRWIAAAGLTLRAAIVIGVVKLRSILVK